MRPRPERLVASPDRAGLAGEADVSFLQPVIEMLHRNELGFVTIGQSLRDDLVLFGIFSIGRGLRLNGPRAMLAQPPRRS